MRSSTQLRRLAAGLLLTVALPSLTACTLPFTSSPESTAEDPADTSAEALRAYYEALLADLKQELLQAKQTDYITRMEYESRITELEAKLNALEESPSGADIPVSGEPAPIPSPDTTPADTDPPDATAAFHYAVVSNGIVIYAYRGTAHEVTIPATITSLPVTRIADDAFRGTAVTSVTVPESVTAIGWFAFADCASLTTVILPASVTAIEYGAFDGCPNLTVHCPEDSYAAEYAASFALRTAYPEE